MDCDGTSKASDEACQTIADNFFEKTGEELSCGSEPPPEVVCPCFTLEELTTLHADFIAAHPSAADGDISHDCSLFDLDNKPPLMLPNYPSEIDQWVHLALSGTPQNLIADAVFANIFYIASSNRLICTLQIDDDINEGWSSITDEFRQANLESCDEAIACYNIIKAAPVDGCPVAP